VQVAVIVASFRRLKWLEPCLDGIEVQQLRAREVIVVSSIDDPETRRYVEDRAAGWPELRAVEVARTGMIAACNRGLGAATQELVAFLDDDAVPAPDWLERIVATFEHDGQVAAVGGRDVIPGGGAQTYKPLLGDADAPPVGIIQWFGRQLGNHHLGTGAPRDVDVLKGVNMAFRRATVIDHGFDERLRGVGAQVNSEMTICLPLRRQGMRIVYDPEIVVMHYGAYRPAGDHRERLVPEVTEIATYNETLAILDYFGPLQRLVFTVWGVAIGSTGSPGLAIWVRDLFRRRPVAGRRLLAAQRGRFTAWDTHRRCPRPPCLDEVATRATHHVT
jgi:GT2 family glycosyltransferase